MSYCTSFQLEVFTPKGLSRGDVCGEGDEEVVRQLRGESEGAQYALCDNGSTSDQCSWYDHGEDLREFSRRHPDLVFKLSGEGEENADIWDKYFQDGKMQVCKAVFTKPPFDPSKLV